MTAAALAAVGRDTHRVARPAPIELRVEDRLQALAAPIRGMSSAMIAITVGSFGAHLLLMAAAMVVARAPLAVPPQHEIAVDIVQDVPKPEAPKPPAPKAPEPKVEQTKLEPPKTAPAKPPEAKLPEPKPAPPIQSKVPPPDTRKLKALQDELASLQAEQAALKAQSEAPSGQALALPSIGGDDGDAIGYQQLVFSQLAKAKGEAEYQGKAGTTSVKFEMDEGGKLVRVEITHSSGDATLDGRALDIIHRAAPFPPPPTAADRIVFANVNFVPPKKP